LLAIEKIHIEQFLQLAKGSPILDVRSPAEFAHAHIPGAYSLPLFSDEERKIVGTTYKQQSREAAIKVGLDFFGPKMRRMVEEVESFFDKKVQIANGLPPDNGQQPSKIVLVHCWRGGMRSAGVAWLLDLYGFKVYTLIGGYKFFRCFVLRQFEVPFAFKILGGYTGSGKTEVLKQLARAGELIIDLEALANHKGSAFGNIGMPEQPSQEMFENLLAVTFAERIHKIRFSMPAEKEKMTDNRWPLAADQERDGVLAQPGGTIWLEELRRGGARHHQPGVGAPGCALCGGVHAGGRGAAGHRGLVGRDTARAGAARRASRHARAQFEFVRYEKRHGVHPRPG